MKLQIILLHIWLTRKIKGSELNAANLRSTYLSAPLVDLKFALLCASCWNSDIEKDFDTNYKSVSLPAGVTKEGAAAIHIYTTNHLYIDLNRALRTQELDRIRPWFAYLKLFHTNVENLPTVDNIFCRGEKSSWIDDYKIGSVVTLWSITSMSTMDHVCNDFIDFATREEKTLFRIKTASARLISIFSKYMDESEYILLPGTKFIIRNKVFEKDNKKRIVELEEISFARINATPSLRTYAQNSCTKKQYTKQLQELSKRSSSKAKSSTLGQLFIYITISVIILVIIVIYYYWRKKRQKTQLPTASSNSIETK